MKLIEIYKSIILENSGKPLYHGTTTHNLPSIKKNGLMPTIGEFVKTMYAGAVEGNIEDYLEDTLYATDKTQIRKAYNAIIFQIGNKLHKKRYEVTDEEFEKYGALAVINNGSDIFDYYEEGDYTSPPIGVEHGDYYTHNSVEPDEILTGSKLTKFFEKIGLYPLKK